MVFGHEICNFLSDPGTSGTTYNWPNLEPIQVAFYLAGEITQVIDSIPWVRCASGNVWKICGKCSDFRNIFNNTMPMINIARDITDPGFRLKSL